MGENATEKYSALKIETHYDFKDSDNRGFDWEAWFNVPHSPKGYGATKDEAIADLVAKISH